MKICVTSDLHGNLPNIPECELVLICGDIIPLQLQFHNPASREWLLSNFLTWANSLATTKVLFIAGNHDQLMERDDNWMRKNFPVFNKVTYLKNELYTYIDCYGKEYKIFGTPYCHKFGNWPFMRSEEFLTMKYSEIPEGLDILFTHDAPLLGKVGYVDAPWKKCEAGNELLTKRILEVTPKLCVCGHIHSGDHNLNEVNGIKFVNTSLVDETYTPIYNIFEYEINN